MDGDWIMTWTKKMPDGSISSGPTVEGPGFFLGPDGGEGVDGWQWIDDPAVPIVEIALSALEQLSADAEAATTSVEYDDAVSQFIASIQQP